MSSANVSNSESVNVVELPNYLKALLGEIAIREGFSADFTIETEDGASHGDGFQSLMLRTTIVGRRSGFEGEQRLKLISKLPPISDWRRSLVAPSFRQEIFAYEKLLPEFIEMQKTHNISEEDGFFAFPKCYGTYSSVETQEYAIVLDDLRIQGYRMWNKLEAIDWTHVKMCLAAMGKYHALSFALRNQKPELLKEFSVLEGGFYNAITAMPQAHDFYIKSFNRAIEVLDENADATLIKKYKHIRDNYIEITRLFVTGSLAEPFAVLCHGDCWNNNMMYKYSNKNSKVAQSVCLIDWQMIQYCSPATDLAYFLLTSTEQKLREEHFDDILNVYYDSLKTMLQLFGGDVDSQISYANFLDQFKQFGGYAIIMIAMLLQIITTEPNDIPDMDEVDIDNMQDFEFLGDDTSKFDTRIREALRDAEKYGWFDTKLVKYET